MNFNKLNLILYKYVSNILDNNTGNSYQSEAILNTNWRNTEQFLAPVKKEADDTSLVFLWFFILSVPAALAMAGMAEKIWFWQD